MDLSIIIPSWNAKNILRENLEAIFKSRGNFTCEVFVVDNGSFDASAEMVRDEFPVVNLITNKKNLGFARANNQAIRKAEGDFILLLNQDMRVRPDTLINMLKWMRENKRAAVASCRLVNSEGNILPHVRRFPALRDQLAIVLKLPQFFPALLNNYILKDFDYERAAPVDSIRGSFFMIRRETIEKIGLLDERYFFWFEEVDYCRQVKKSGLEVWYTPVAACLDYAGYSAGKLPRGQSQKYMRDSQLKYFRKWHRAWEYWLLRLTWPLGLFLVWAGERAGFKRKKVG